jgi:hypothetical protein
MSEIKKLGLKLALLDILLCLNQAKPKNQAKLNFKTKPSQIENQPCLIFLKAWLDQAKVKPS